MPGRLFYNLRLFDGLEPKLRGNRVVLVRDGRIAAVDDEANLPRFQDCERIDLRDATLLPGLIDMHVQIGVPFIRKVNLKAVMDLNPQIRKNMSWCLHSGVTTVRDMSGIPGILRKYRRLIDSRKIPGPRIFCAHSFITCPGGYPDMAPFFNPIQRWMVGGQFAERLETPEQMRDCVRRMTDLGADWIKTGYSTESYFAGRPDPLPVPSDECYRAIVDEAHKLGRPVALHQTSVAGMRKGVELGVQTLEHIPSEPIPDDLIEEILKKKIAVIPTFSAPAAYLDLEESSRWLEDEGRGFFEAEPYRQTRHLLDLLMKDFHTPEELERCPLMDIPMIRYWWETSPSLFDNARRLHEAGVTMGCGSDAGGELVFLGRIHKELEYLSRAGLTTFEALQAGTITSARILGKDDEIGTIEPGKRADMIAVSGDPIESLACLEEVLLVVKDGNLDMSKL
jgi:imidazolonepropionase-like amidohydrolase